MDLKDIKAIIDLMKKNSITEFELERQDSKIKLKRGLNGGSASSQSDEYTPQNFGSLPQTTVSTGNPPPVVAPVVTGEIDVKSPMIGTFYRAPSPEASNYIDVCHAAIWLPMHPKRCWPDYRQPCSVGTPIIEDYPPKEST